MYVDKHLLVSDGQSITIDAVSDYSINLKAAGRDIGAGRPLYFVIVVDTAANANDSAKTVTFSVVQDDAATLAGPTVLVSSAAITGAALTAARTPIILPVPPHVSEQYIGVQYDVSATFTAFTVTAFLALDATIN